MILVCNRLFFLLVLLLPGDVHPNPGPDPFTEFVSLSKSNSLVSIGNINMLDVNIESILPRLEILEAEMQSYDSLAFTETLLSPQIYNDDILITNSNRIVSEGKVA